jgi:hypothetical protein
LDGANVEIRDAVGHENFFLSGLTGEEVTRRKAEDYTPRNTYESNPELREGIDLISSGFFSKGDRGLFLPLVDSLLSRDDPHAPGGLSGLRARNASARRTQIAMPGRGCPFSIARDSAASRPTTRSGSIAATFGRSRRLFLTKDEPDADHKQQV